MPKQTSRATGDPDERAGADPRAGADQRPAPHADVAGLTYEQARDELVAVVARLESGAESLEESLALWERGEALASRCQQWLDGARERLAAARGDRGPGDRGPGDRTAGTPTTDDPTTDDRTTDDGTDQA